MKEVHGMIKMNPCEECSYKSFRKSRLKEHQKAVHEKIKDNQCDQCDYSTARRDILKKHQRVVHLST